MIPPQEAVDIAFNEFDFDRRNVGALWVRFHRQSLQVWRKHGSSASWPSGWRIWLAAEKAAIERFHKRRKAYLALTPKQRGGSSR
jgi:hypothetical protein